MGILRTDRVSGLGGANAIKGSVNFTGSRYAESYFDIDASTDFAFGTGDFTIECWINLTHDDADNYYKRVYMTDGPTGNASGNFQIAIVPSTGVVNLWEVSGSLDVSGSTKVTKVGWVHIAAVRSGSGSNNLKLYVNGVQDAQTTYTTSISPNSGNPRPRIGAYAEDQGGSLPGHVSNLRVSNEALYTSAFTRPTTELEKLSSTILLCFQSPSNILKEETDKILIPRRNNTNGAFPSASRFTPNSPVGFSTTTDVGTQFGSTFDGVTTFDSQAYMVPPGGNTRERNRGRGIVCGGYVSPSPTYNQTIEFITIQSMGNAIDFGDLSSVDKGAGSTLANETRAVCGGGFGSPINIGSMDFFTIATQSNTTAANFGDLINQIRNLTSLANSTRGIFAGGTNNPATPGIMFDTIQFITIATAGDATDFGNMQSGRRDSAALSSSTRGIIAGGNPGSGPQVTDEIDFITIASAGNAQDFGNMTNSEREIGGAASSTRGIIFGGYSSPAFRNTIDFVTIATTGNAQDFGDLTVARTGPDGCSNKTRGAMCGGSSPTYQNLIDFVTLATTGNAADFGDLSQGKIMNSGCTSDSHGGLE